MPRPGHPASGKSSLPRHWACPGGSTAFALLAYPNKQVVQRPLNHRGELGGGVCLELPLSKQSAEALGRTSDQAAFDEVSSPGNSIPVEPVVVAGLWITFQARPVRSISQTVQ